jgi:DNA invertase Pin-like site-specific DNA recombinase
MSDSTAKPPKAVALYARVSTLNGQDPEVQLAPLRAHVAQRGWEIAAEYVDVGWSGSKDRRPSLDKMMKDAWAGKFQAVLVWRFDRFARSTKHLITALETFRSVNVSFVSLQEQFDLSSPIGAAMFTIIGAMGQLERDLVIERVRAGLAQARARGVKLGPKFASLDMAKVEALMAGGLSIRAAARAIGASPETVRRRLALANRTMVGNSTAANA